MPPSQAPPTPLTRKPTHRFRHFAPRFVERRRRGQKGHRRKGGRGEGHRRDGVLGPCGRRFLAEVAGAGVDAHLAACQSCIAGRSESEGEGSGQGRGRRSE
eukprot:12799690-Alexandrium_andersonii.AAC.1